MTDFISENFIKYRKKGIFVDTGILLLYIIGSFNLRSISGHKVTAMFDEDDFYIASDFIGKFEKIITSPHVLTEVSNQLPDKSDFFTIFESYINDSAIEKFINSSEITMNKGFAKFGLADSAIVEISKDSHLIFTSDNRFYAYLNSIGVDALNFDSLKLAY
jgi:predicted nucleic acid-binding protein